MIGHFTRSPSRRVKDAGTPQEEGKHMDYLHSDTQADPKHDL